jgi:hypothetical protein
VQWILRPNSWILVDRGFRNGPEFSYWYYSDNERIHIDMLSFGRYAHSNILGRICYENLAQTERYDPRAASYRAFRKTPVIDAALDIITDLVGDGRSDLVPVRQRYGTDAVRVLEPVLAQLEREQQIAADEGGWRPIHTDGVFIDPFWPLVDAAMRDAAGAWTIPIGKHADNGIRVGTGERSLLVFIEQIHPDKPYYRAVGRLGIYYRHPTHTPAPDPDSWVDDVMGGLLDSLAQLVDRAPNISAKAATAALKRAYSAAPQ